MDFRVLGPLEIYSDSGTVVPLSSRAAQRALSVLLLYAPRVCTQETLIEALWSGRPQPRDAAASVRSLISKIRRDPGIGSRLLTVGSDYRMEPAKGELDLARFRNLSGRALEVRGKGDPEQAVALLAAALACWRDPPLADPPLADLPQSPAIVAEITLLAAQRTIADSAFIDLMLDLGRHRKLLPELHRRVILAPLDERARYQLILALYRDGRRGESIAAYSRAREELIRILGTEPGAELRNLHQQILAESRELELAPR